MVAEPLLVVGAEVMPSVIEPPPVVEAVAVAVVVAVASPLVPPELGLAPPVSV